MFVCIAASQCADISSWNKTLHAFHFYFFFSILKCVFRRKFFDEELIVGGL